MALVDGTNCGFVTTAPSSDPAASSGGFSMWACASKKTSPSGTNRVTAIGWWQDNTSNGVDAYSAGIYSHDAVNNNPNVLIATAATGQSVQSNTAGWYAYTGLSIGLSASTVYWIAVGCEGSDSNTIDITDDASQLYTYKGCGNNLPETWGEKTGFPERLIAIYAVYEAAAGGQPTIKRWGGVPGMNLNKGVW